MADINKDGALDIVTANAYGDTVTVLYNSGTGSFPLAGTAAKDADGRTDFKTSGYPNSLKVGDVDGDTWPDLVVGCVSVGIVTVLYNDGAGGFPTLGTSAKDGDGRTDFTFSSGSPMWLELGDVDGDLDLDIAGTEGGTDTVAVLYNDGTGNFGGKRSFPVGDCPYCVDLGDIDLDGDLDIATVNSNDNTLTYLFNNGHGTFYSKTTYSVGTQPRYVMFADLDNDVDQDLLSCDYSDQGFTVLLNRDNTDYSPDTDGDGYADAVDEFPENTFEWVDSDGDGYGDNGDALPANPM